MFNNISCQTDNPYPVIGWVIIGLLLSFCAFYIFRKRKDNLTPTVSVPKDEFNKLVPLNYARECMCLSQLRMEELVDSIKTFEKKAFAIITGAAALIIFMTSQQWCNDITGQLAIACILFSIFAAIFSGFVISTTHVGLGGSVPSVMLKYHQEQLCNIEYEDEENLKEREEIEISFLLLQVLESYQSAMRTSEQAIENKGTKLSCATNCVWIAVCNAVAWLLIKFWFVFF